MSVDNEGNRSAGHHKKAKDTQIGGDHYKNMKIEPITFFARNQTPFPEANTCKYILRHRHKNGIEDLKKARHMIDLMIEEYYPEDMEALARQAATAAVALSKMEPLIKGEVPTRENVTAPERHARECGCLLCMKYRGAEEQLSKDLEAPEQPESETVFINTPCGRFEVPAHVLEKYKT